MKPMRVISCVRTEKLENLNNILKGTNLHVISIVPVNGYLDVFYVDLDYNQEPKVERSKVHKKIVINHEIFDVEKESLSYYDILALANQTYGATCVVELSTKSGILSKDKSVEVEDGMIITCIQTNNA